MPATNVPRERTSETYRRLAAQKAAYDEHVADVRRYTWHLGVLDGAWRLKRTNPTTGQWVLLEDRLEAFPDIDVIAERKRTVSWVREVLAVRSTVRERDYEAQDRGHDVWEIAVTG